MHASTTSHINLGQRDKVQRSNPSVPHSLCCSPGLAQRHTHGVQEMGFARCLGRLTWLLASLDAQRYVIKPRANTTLLRHGTTRHSSGTPQLSLHAGAHIIRSYATAHVLSLPTVT